MKDENIEKAGQLIDELDNLMGAAQLPMSADFHLTQLKKLIPEVTRKLKVIIEDENGEKIWSD